MFTGAADLVSLGEVVTVTGFARERFNQTTINGANSNTAAVPAVDISHCGTGSVAPTDVALPFANAGFPERYEGMSVRFPQPLVISEYFNYGRFGEMVLALPLEARRARSPAPRSTNPVRRPMPARWRTACGASRSTTRRAPRTPRCCATPTALRSR